MTNITFSLLSKSGYDSLDSERAASILKKAEEKEYGGMFEAAIESIIEEREEAREEGREEGLREGLIETARKALAKGATIDFIHAITGLDIETIKSLASN